MRIQKGDKVFVVADTYPILYQPDGITGIVIGFGHSERIVWVADRNGYTGTGLPRDAVCLVPEGHMGQPCQACGLSDSKEVSA